ncbi:MAG: hypothetical protein JWN68_1443 [Nocardioides sp.]|jgi:hypothetical protein|uniref:DUF2332 domain-containing protein n=1 Tax=Nocardioides sp. TaxID=35761 RepID=UPI002619235C|nr:DUF2332 domain-containing protein [Nocardioides sp.]MCW2833490.1 hypothetical protein [Nocardioides sp.]
MQMDGDIAERYRDFAAYAEGDSDCFVEWALGVAGDPEVHDWLAVLPRGKQQPNLVFAAARWHGAQAPAPYAELKRVLRESGNDVLATIRDQATQTNEVGRLATLVPVFARIEAEDGPLSLIEVGASAGLCLYPDRYDYAWPHLGALGGTGGPTLTADATGQLPVPARHPEIAWRGGVDLNPLDVRDEDAMAWLTNLVWPEQDDRRTRLREAVAVARQDPPTIVRGDLAVELPGLVRRAAEHGAPVVFHSAVIAYLDDEARQHFHDAMTDLVAAGTVRWVSNEAPRVLPGVTHGLDVPSGRFVLGLDGRPVALTHGHGHAIHWL